MKNLFLIDKRKKKLNNIETVGYGGYVDVTEFIKNPVDKDKKKQQRRLKRYNKTIKKLFRFFKTKKPKKGFIFITHYTPYKCLDKVRSRDSPMHGKNVGFEPYNQIIRKYSPSLVICGHMHENQGKCKIGKSIVVNPGSAREGKAAIIEIDDKKKKVKSVKFLR